MAGALVLSRRIDESVMVDDDIEVFVAEIRGTRVKLGFVADPKRHRIHRKEVWLRIQESRDVGGEGGGCR